MKRGVLEIGSIVALIAIGSVMLFRVAAAPPPEVEIAGYATSLQGRTVSQRHNARLAAEALNGKVVAAGATFSFNQTVKSWSQDQGYVKAPVSYDGELIKAFGGGVCQTSTTLYNVALLAGLPILERHTHIFAPHYVPPGRDAAVAQKNIDLQFRNPYPWPIRIKATAQEDRLDIRLYGASQPAESVQIISQVLDTIAPSRLTRVAYRPEGTAGRSYLRNPGATGCRVVTYRLFCRNGQELRRERLADSTYQPMDRIVQVTEEGP